MIKAIITDVDGVIVGDKEGVNFPLPNEKIIQKLKAINKSGIPVIFCTGKPSYSIEDIIIKAELDNPHITDGGAFIYNPLRKQIIKEHVIPTALVVKIVEICLENNIYIEVQSANEYFLQKNQFDAFTEIREKFLQKPPVLVDSLIASIKNKDVIKMLPFIKGESEKLDLEILLNPFNDATHAIWSTAPILLPSIARIITLKDVSKMHASQEVVDYLNISFDEVLGIGDLPVDWKFMKLCKYAAGIGNMREEFKQNIMSKGEGNYFLASSVDDDGFIDIINHFTNL